MEPPSTPPPAQISSMHTPPRDPTDHTPALSSIADLALCAGCSPKVVDVVLLHAWHLPYEIIATFMALVCVDDASSALENSKPYPNYSPVHPLMLVSREWYSVACSMAHLWSSLELDISSPAYDTSAVSELLQKAERWFGRASECPLMLRIKVGSGRAENRMVWEYLGSISSRVGELDIEVVANTGNTDEHPAALLEMPITPGDLHANVDPEPLRIWKNMSSFHYRDFSRPASFGSYLSSSLQDPSVAFPSLTSLTLLVPHIKLPTVNTPFWSKLTSLKLGALADVDPVPLYLQALSQCSSLLSCTLVFPNVDLTQPLPEPASYFSGGLSKATLPSLTHLKIYTSTQLEEVAIAIVHHLDHPSLLHGSMVFIDEGTEILWGSSRSE